jgi:RNA polymerase sigma-70 factor (ECF subfamily)
VANEFTSLELLLADGPACQAGSDDSQLVAGLRSGEEWAYESLIERFQQPVYNLVCRLIWDPEEACDVVQEVFLKIFRKIDSFRGASSLKTWVYRIAVNEAHNHCRWNGRHKGHEVGLEASEDVRSYGETLPASGESPYQYVLDREQRRLLEVALAELSPSYRSVVVLRDVEDMSYEEIAEVLRLPLGTVKSRLLRGREALRVLLQKRLEPAAEIHWQPQLVE